MTQRYLIIFTILILCIPAINIRLQAQTSIEFKPGIQQFSLQDTTLANELLKQGKTLTRAGKYDSSNYCFEQAKEIYEQLSEQHDLEMIWEGIVHCYDRIGWNLFRTGKYERSFHILKRALEIGIPKLSENHIDIAQTHSRIGIVVYIYQGDFDKAVQYTKKSLSTRLLLLGEKHLAVATSYNDLGNFYSRADIDQALKYHHKSLMIRLRLLGENDPVVAGSYNNLGVMYRQKGNYRRALEYSQKSLEIYLRLFEEDHPDVARTYMNIGNIYAVKSDYDLALEYHQKSLTIKLQLLGEDHLAVASSYNNIGNIYAEKSYYDQALEYYQNDLSITIKLLGEDHPNVAVSYNNIGNIYRQKGDYRRAFEYFQKSLAINFRLVGKDHPDVAEILYNIGEMYREQGNYAKAIEYYQKTLAIGLKSFGILHPQVGAYYRGLAKAYFRKNDLKQALSYCQKSLNALASEFDESSIYKDPSIENTSDLLSLLEILELKAKVLIALSLQTGHRDLEMALTTYNLATELIYKMRTGYKAEGSKLWLSETTHNVYEGGIETAMRLDRSTQDEYYKTAAFQFAEKSKAGTLSQTLHDANAKKFAGIPDSLLSQEYDLKIDLAFYETQIQQEQQKKAEQDSAKLAKFESRFFTYKTEYNSLIERFENEFPKYYELKYETGTASVQDIQEALDQETTILEYFVGQDSVYIFTIAKNLFEVTTASKESLFKTNIQQLRNSLQSSNVDPQKFLNSAFRLYNTLLAPAANFIQTENVIIIPDGIISYIPFEVLLSKPTENDEIIDYASLPYLIHNYNISYAFSATLFLKQQDQVKEKPAKDFLAFAPVFRDGIVEDSRAADIVRSNDTDFTRESKLLALPDTREEVLGIQNLFREKHSMVDKVIGWFGEEKTRVYLNKTADEENFKSENLYNYRFIHFATHGFASHSSPDLSGLVFAQDSTSEEDDVLFLPEIYNLNLNASLVTLSACESGTGKLIRGEGLLSLSRGFLYAGANNLLVSLWKVKDKTTRELMITFYNEMLSGKFKSEALKLAKMQLIDAKPYYWAPFILIGN